MARRAGVSNRLIEVTATLRSRIEDGTWPDGYQLPTERELANEYGLARNTLRRALIPLQEEGLIVREIGRGTFVSQSPKSCENGLLDRMLEASPADLMEVRLIIEPQATALAAARASADDLREIEYCFEESMKARETQSFISWDSRLHRAIFQAAKNDLLMDYCDCINVIRTQPDWIKLKARAITSERLIYYDGQHSAIVSAIRAHDADAARAAQKEHLMSVQANLFGAAE